MSHSKAVNNEEQKEKLKLLREHLLNQHTIQNDTYKIIKIFSSETEAELKSIISDEKIKTEDIINKPMCAPQCFCDGSCKKPQPLDNNKECLGWQIKRGEPVEYNRTESQKGKKETEGKLNYEISWRFIEEMAKRMQNNKGNKYPAYNWKKPINVEDLKQAINRHHIEVMEGNYKDGDEELGHVVSYACNAMMLWWQLKNNLK